MMGLSTLLALLLAIGLCNATDPRYRKELSAEDHESSFKATSWKPLTVTVDWVFSETGHWTMPTAPVIVSTKTSCVQKCVTITLSKTTGHGTSSAEASAAAPSFTVSCVTIHDTTSHGSESIASSSSSPVTAVGTPDSSLSTSTTTTTITTTSTTTKRSSRGSSLPCSTDITVTETLTTTVKSMVPVTQTLVRTRLSTLTTVIVEAYSTSTGTSTRTIVEKTTATTTKVSLGSPCSSEAEEKCPFGHSSGVNALGSSEHASGTPPASVVSTGTTQPPVYISTPVVSTVSSSSNPVTSGAGGGDSETSTNGDNVPSTAGAAAVTAGVGMGVLVGIIVAMA